MNDHMKLTEILMDELPEEHPWKGNIKGLVERLIANGVTVQKKSQKVKPRKRKQKEISQDTLNALNAIGQQSHREFADSSLFGHRNKIN